MNYILIFIKSIRLMSMRPDRQSLLARRLGRLWHILRKVYCVGVYRTMSFCAICVALCSDNICDCRFHVQLSSVKYAVLTQGGTLSLPQFAPVQRSKDV